MDKLTIFGLAVVIVTAAGLTFVIHDDYHKNQMDLEYNNQPLSIQEQMDKLKNMTCIEFDKRNSNGVDYLSGEVRDVAKEIKGICN